MRHALAVPAAAPPRSHRINSALGALARLVLCGMAFGATIVAPARAQPAPYPDRPVQVVVAWQAGGLIDSVARAFAQAMSEVSDGRFVVINRDGGGGIIGAQAVAGARPNGYTLGFGPITPITTAAHSVRNVPFSVDSFEYVCKVFENVMGIAVAEQAPQRSMPDLIAAIRARPGAMTYAHNGMGSLSHLYFANVTHDLSLRIVDVAYRGEAGMLPELISGRVDIGVVTLGGIRGQPVRLLTVFGDDRSPEAPDVPSTRELGLPTLQPVLAGLMVPQGTPRAIVERLDTLCRSATETAAFRDVMARFGQPVRYADQASFTAQAHRDSAAKLEVVRTLGLLPH
ncbi:MAG TPA: tripartite tricarboxylate transporter substrate binding protein [Roseomonas sp.]|jgi:tripartite-type tricarboxylate transporter receptor subunit TctC